MVGAAAASARRLAVRASARGLSDSSATLMRRRDFFFGATLGLLGIADNGGVWGQVRTFTSTATAGGGGGVCASVFNDFVPGRLSNTLVYQMNMFSSSVNPQNQGGTVLLREMKMMKSKRILSRTQRIWQ